MTGLLDFPSVGERRLQTCVFSFSIVCSFHCPFSPSSHQHLTLATCHSCFSKNCTGLGPWDLDMEGTPDGKDVKTTGFPTTPSCLMPVGFQGHSQLQRSHLGIIGKLLESGTWRGLIIWIFYLSLKLLWKKMDIGSKAFSFWRSPQFPESWRPALGQPLHRPVD